MNTFLKELIKTESPKIVNLDSKEQDYYLLGMKLLSVLVCEEFFDIPKLPSTRFDKDGLYYSLPYFDDDALWSSGNSRTFLVLYKVENKSSYCPLRLDIVADSEKDYSIFVYDQTGLKTIKKRLVVKENGEYFTDIKDYSTVVLSKLIDIK
jgi:hypothetical protein